MGASAAFTFNGTNVVIYASKQSNHGNYSVSLDGGDPLLFSGFADFPGLFQAPIYDSGDLPQDLHSVIVTNLEYMTFDIDSVSTRVTFVEYKGQGCFRLNGDAVDFVDVRTWFRESECQQDHC